MPIKNACFISYRRYEGNELAETLLNGLYTALKNELEPLIGPGRVYRDDKGGMGPGSLLPQSLSRDICESACMVVVYGFTTAGPLLITIIIVFAFALLGGIRVRQLDQKRQVAGIVAGNLAEVEAWWKSLPQEQRAEQANIEKLVIDTENALKDDRSQSWLKASQSRS
jgi:hypothetical protein